MVLAIVTVATLPLEALWLMLLWGAVVVHGFGGPTMGYGTAVFAVLLLSCLGGCCRGIQVKEGK